MKTLIVHELTRPNINAHKQMWTAVDFTCNEAAAGKYKYLRLQWAGNPSEIWEFLNATVMLSRDGNRYIMTYDNVVRVTRSSK